MQHIIPHLWFDKEAEEAATFYTSIFKNSKIGDTSRYTDAGKEIHKQEPGAVMTIEFELEGYKFIGLNAGPIFKFTPAISFFIRCATEAEVDDLYAKLVEGGSVLMPLQKWPFSEKYAWVADKYGLTWQIFLGDADQQKITPCLMYVGDQSGKAEEAMKLYTSLFPNSKIGDITRYPQGMAPDKEGTVMHASFWLEQEEFMAMDSAQEHHFSFTEAISFLVHRDTQEELDALWEKLSAVPESEQCGWLKDKYGVSWQIVPSILGKLFSESKNADKLMEAMLSMKKLNIEELTRAAE